MGRGKKAEGYHAFYGLDVARQLLVFGAFPPGSFGQYSAYVTGVSSAGFSGQLTKGGDHDAWSWVVNRQADWPHFLRTNMQSTRMNEMTKAAAAVALTRLEMGVAENIGTLEGVPRTLAAYQIRGHPRHPAETQPGETHRAPMAHVTDTSTAGPNPRPRTRGPTDRGGMMALLSSGRGDHSGDTAEGDIADGQVGYADPENEALTSQAGDSGKRRRENDRDDARARAVRTSVGRSWGNPVTGSGRADTLSSGLQEVSDSDGSEDFVGPTTTHRPGGRGALLRDPRNTEM